MTAGTTTAALPLVQVARSTRAIRERLISTLNHSDRPELVELAITTPSADAADHVCLVFVGQYNSGKSSLITCLTGMELEIGSDVTTRSAATFPWYGHLLVDTPGVRAGSDASHDVAADRALDVADAVVFVLTSEGFDETTASYFLQLLARLRSEGQLIVVVNKAHSEESDRLAILADLRRVYEEIDGVIPLVWTEARDWLTADSYPSPEIRRQRSEVPGLAATINEMTRRRGAQMRLATPLRELSRHVRRALDHAVEESYRGMLDALDVLADGTETRRGQLLDAVRVIVEQTRSDLVADLIELSPVQEADAVDTTIARAQQQFVDALNERSDRVIQDASKVLAILESPLPPQTDGVSADAIWAQVRLQLLDGLRVISRHFEGASARPGGLGHRLITTGWHAAGGKFKPWGAVKAAKNVGKAAKFGGAALVVGEGAVGVWLDYRSHKRAVQDAADLRDWTAAAGQIARETVGSWSAAASEAAHAMCDDDLRTIGRQRLALLATMSDSSTTAQALADLDDEILALLITLSQGVSSDGFSTAS